MQDLIKSGSFTSAYGGRSWFSPLNLFAYGMNWMADTQCVVLHLICLYCMSGLLSAIEAFTTVTVHHALCTLGVIQSRK